MIPYGRQSIDASDIRAVVEALQSGWLTCGPSVEEFERKFAEYVGADHAVAVCNGTAALHLAMLVAGIDRGDRVVTSPNTFLASANCAAYVGAVPDFSDIDPVSYCLCPRTLAENWKPDTRAVVAVDYAGQTCDMPAISEVAREYGAIVIEDACHAVGGRFEHDGRVYRVGGHTWADITTFSFHPVKTMTTGEGGMLVTDSDQYARKARTMRNHGMVREASCFLGLGNGRFAERGPWYYEMQHLGHNFRISDIQCALGLSQLASIDKFASRRREIIERYNGRLRDVPGITLPRLRNEADRDLTSWHLYTVQIDFPALRTTRTDFMNALREQGIGSQVLYIPVHLQPWYRDTYGYRAGKCPASEDYYQRALSLPLFPALSDAGVEKVIEAVRQIAVRPKH